MPPKGGVKKRTPLALDRQAPVALQQHAAVPFPPYVPPLELAQSLTRDPRVTVRSDKRGNLGPASVVVQAEPGSDWIRDRWQAASDMGGTAIPGKHWLVLDLGREATASKAVLDWEAAFANKYQILVSSAPPLGDSGDPEGAWREAFDASAGAASVGNARQVGQWGQVCRQTLPSLILSFLKERVVTICHCCVPGRTESWSPT